MASLRHALHVAYIRYRGRAKSYRSVDNLRAAIRAGREQNPGAPPESLTKRLSVTQSPDSTLEFAIYVVRPTGRGTTAHRLMSIPEAKLARCQIATFSEKHA